ncbi:MAG: hypothetical protein LAP40_16810 [Acidobacteriia bacterium]|nr:hypothetical protein [Terriglobia bacterium]
MAVARENRATSPFSALLAGLQAGMIGVLWMLAWLGVSAAWQRSSFWAPENLLASTFYGGEAIHSGFSTTTVSGWALYLLLYSALGGIWAAAVQGKLPRIRLALVSIVLAVGWYYLFFQVICRTLSPLVTLLHVVRPTILGHVIYGALVARFPRYLPGVASEEELPAAVESVADPEPANRPDA